jgi:hypothetical protein
MKSNYIIDKSDIINIEDYKVIEPIINCSICCGILFEPMMCIECENCFCLGCINDWKRKSNTCPFKCQKAKYKESKLAKRVLGILKLKCKNGCGETINYNDISSHYDEKCPKIDFRKKYFELKNKYDKIIKESKINLIKFDDENNIDNIDELNKHIIPDFNYLSKHHKHKLGFVTTNREGWKCNLCKNSLNNKVKSYYCTLCDYDLCQDCILKEKKEKGEKVGNGDLHFNINDDNNIFFNRPFNINDNLIC